MEQEIATLQKVYSVMAEFIVNYSFQILGAILILILIIGAKLAGSLSPAVIRLCDKKQLDATLSRFLANMVKILILTFVIGNTITVKGVRGVVGEILLASPSPSRSGT